MKRSERKRYFPRTNSGEIGRFGSSFCRRWEGGLLWLQPNKMLFIKGNVVLLCYERPK